MSGCISEFCFYARNHHKCHEEILLPMNTTISNITYTDTDVCYLPVLEDFSLGMYIILVIALYLASAGNRKKQ